MGGERSTLVVNLELFFERKNCDPVEFFLEEKNYSSSRQLSNHIIDFRMRLSVL